MNEELKKQVGKLVVVQCWMMGLQFRVAGILRSFKTDSLHRDGPGLERFKVIHEIDGHSLIEFSSRRVGNRRQTRLVRLGASVSVDEFTIDI